VGSVSLQKEREHGSMASSLLSGSFNGSFLGGSGGGGQDVQESAWLTSEPAQDLLDMDERVRQEQMNQLRNYNTQFQDLKEMEQYLGIQALESQDGLDEISRKMEKTDMHVESVVENLEEADKLAISANYRKCICIILIVMVVGGASIAFFAMIHDHHTNN